MEGYGSAITKIILGIVLLCISIFWINQNSKKLISHYNKRLEMIDFDFKCVLICKYIDGIENLVRNTTCYLLANDTQLIAIPMDRIDTKIILDLSKIKLFQYTNQLASNILNFQYKTQNSLTLHYLSDNNKIKELSFSLLVSAEENKFNKYSLSKCNLYDFVNKRIPKQETTIDL